MVIRCRDQSRHDWPCFNATGPFYAPFYLLPPLLLSDSLPLHIPSSACIVWQFPLPNVGPSGLCPCQLQSLGWLWNDVCGFLIAHQLAWQNLFLVIVSVTVHLSGLCVCILWLLPPLFLIPFDKVLDQINLREQMLSPSTFPYRNHHGKNLIMMLRPAVDLVSLLL